MAATVYATANYRFSQVRNEAQPVSVSSSATAEVVFVPTGPNIAAPIRKAARAFQWRRQLSDYLGSVISGAVSLR